MICNTRSDADHGRQGWIATALLLASLSAALSLLTPAPVRAAPAQEPESGPGETLAVFHTDQAIRVDGLLSEEAWREAQVVSDFTQQEPRVGEPATERTEVRVLVNGSTLYIGVTCFDDDVAGIIGRERRRDNALSNDDRFEVVLDTFHDHRSGFYFVTNPLGTRSDALITDDGTNVNRQWDEGWWVETRITDTGWTLEFEIPLSILRASEDVDAWGINFLRFVRRKNEISSWRGWSRDFAFTQVSQAGHLEGMRGTQTGLLARVKPYLLAGGRQLGGENAGTSEIGIENAKIGISPSLVAEFTANPDFAQVDVDDAVVNLTRFPLFFPEKREFFLEGAGTFDFSLGGRRGGGTERVLQMFFSRRIGLTADRRPAPIIAGGKLIGRTGGMDVGVLSVQTDQFEGEPGDNFSVFRVKRNILARSNIGAFASSRQASEGTDYNRVAGAEATFTFLGNTDVHGSFARSFTSNISGGQQMMARAKFDRLTEKYELFAEHLYIGDDFYHDLGYVLRRGIRRSDLVATWDPRPDIWDLRRMAIKGEVVYLTDTNNHRLTGLNNLQVRAHRQSGAYVGIVLDDQFERLERPFRITDDITIPVGDYRFLEPTFEFNSRPDRTLSWVVRAGKGSFYDGTRTVVRVAPTFRPSSAFSAEVSYEYNDVELDEGSFDTHVLNSRVNVNLTNRWLTTAFVKYDTDSESLTFFFRLRFNYRPLDDLFIVVNQTSAIGDRVADTDRAVLLKFTRSFEF
jgi:hypothetical protein